MRVAHRNLFQAHRDDDTVSNIRKDTNGNYSLGNDHFKNKIETMLKSRATTPGQPGDAD